VTAMFIKDGLSITYPWLTGAVETCVATCPTSFAASKRKSAVTTLLGLTSLGPKKLNSVVLLAKAFGIKFPNRAEA
jgi:hypothetical protein